jgi:hypothetical protein
VGDFRARDADRDRYVEIIEAAYVDGQLGDQDRELRISRALSAETLAELDMITRDLQGRPEPLVRVTPVPAASGDRRRGLSAAWIVAAVVGLVGLGVPALWLSGGERDAGPAISIDVAVPTESPASQPVAEEPVTFEMTPADVRAFLRAYEEQFSTLDAFEARFYPGWAGADVPVRGARPRMERWTWRGAWAQDSEATRVSHTSEIVDLGTLDVRRLFANIATAKRTLNVQRGELTHVLVHRWSGDVPNVNIYIANKFSESGFIRTTLSGEVIGRFPYAP